MQYRLVDDDDDDDEKFVNNLFRRYSRIRVAALSEAIRIAKYHLGLDTAEKIPLELREIIENEGPDYTDNLAIKHQIILDTYKMGDARKLIQK